MSYVFVLRYRVTEHEPWRHRVISDNKVADAFARGLDAMGIRSYSYSEIRPMSSKDALEELKKILESTFDYVPISIEEEELEAVFNGKC